LKFPYSYCTATPFFLSLSLSLYAASLSFFLSLSLSLFLSFFLSFFLTYTSNLIKSNHYFLLFLECSNGFSLSKHLFLSIDASFSYLCYLLFYGYQLKFFLSFKTFPSLMLCLFIISSCWRWKNNEQKKQENKSFSLIFWTDRFFKTGPVHSSFSGFFTGFPDQRFRMTVLTGTGSGSRSNWPVRSGF
jgi:hypothetical protein